MNGPCVKQRVIATIITPSGERFVGENDCANPQSVCPRSGMATGEGYHLCASVCCQTGHAEINALKAARRKAKGAAIYIQGHSYACEPCKYVCAKAGIVSLIIGKPPEEAAE